MEQWSFEFKQVDPVQMEVQNLIYQLDRYQVGLYGKERCNLDSIEELSGSNVLMLGALHGTELGGIGAVKLFGDYAEIKRVIVEPKFRGKRLAVDLVSKLEAHVLNNNLGRVCLETGFLQKEAIRLYSKLGYKRIQSFGQYKENEVSIYMEKLLWPFMNSDRSRPWA